VQDVRVAIYARYSSDNQRDASIADQLRVCRAHAESQGWSICEEYTDHAVSGATLLRAGFQALMRDALNRRFGVVLAESLDRFSRDQEDTAGLFKRVTFAGVNVVTLAEGDITHLHIGFKGTMNALFPKDLAEKTHRGLRGRVEDGKSAGGLCYGYRVVKALNGGAVTTGEREVVAEEARIVERIFREFVAGKSPKQIAKNLNREGVAGPFGGAWSPSTIYGNGRRGAGILNNELYIGRLVWNRLRYVKNPDTGKRVSRLNPESEWMRKEVPDLRIICDELWTDAKERQEHGRRAINTAGNPGGARRPQYLFSGLTKSGICGAGFIMAGKHRLGCFGAREQGRCDNHLTIRRDEVEARVLKSAAGEASESGSVRRVLRGIHPRDEPTADGAARETVVGQTRSRADQQPDQETAEPDARRRDRRKRGQGRNQDARRTPEGADGSARDDRRAAAPPASRDGRHLPHEAQGARQGTRAARQPRGGHGCPPRPRRRHCAHACGRRGGAGHRAARQPGGDARSDRTNKRATETGALSLQVSMVAGAGFEPATFGL
jgi:DNA invertase Pin-like site-specific DNA recombinase